MSDTAVYQYVGPAALELFGVTVEPGQSVAVPLTLVEKPEVIALLQDGQLVSACACHDPDVQIPDQEAT